MTCLTIQNFTFLQSSLCQTKEELPCFSYLDDYQELSKIKSIINVKKKYVLNFSLLEFFTQYDFTILIKQCKILCVCSDYSVTIISYLLQRYFWSFKMSPPCNKNRKIRFYSVLLYELL